MGVVPDSDVQRNRLPKSMSGIPGFDEITNGGLPRGRPTLVCGSAGVGKTIFGVQFLAQGIHSYEEPGVLVTFEESKLDLMQNMASIGWDLNALCEQKKLVVEPIINDSIDMVEAGEYDLEGLFVRLDAAIRSVRAKRMVIDPVETLFNSYSNAALVRSVFRRLIHWLKEQEITVVLAAEPGLGTLTRFGVEEYVTDCVVSLSQVHTGQITRRYLRILKYRGSEHGTNSYPFLISDQGIHLFPVTELGMEYQVSKERLSSGIPKLDEMLGGKGFYRASSILLTGTAGTGKSSVAASFVSAACQQGESALYISYEESQDQIIRNMKSIGLNLKTWIDREKLTFHTTRVTTHGLEEHICLFQKLIERLDPEVVVIDPMSNLLQLGTLEEVKNVLSLMVDFLKSRGITTLFIDLTSGKGFEEASNTDISSLMDAWLLLRDIENAGERTRGLYIIKSRGMKHSHQIREFLLSENGIDLVDVYAGPSGLLTGTARYTQETMEEEELRKYLDKVEHKRIERESKRRLKEARLEELKAEFQEIEDELAREIQEAEDIAKSIQKQKSYRRSLRDGY